MTALTNDRNTPQLAAATTVYAGALVMRNAAGFLLSGATAAGSVGVGRAEEQVDNSTGSNGDKTIMVRPGVFRFANSAAADLIAQSEIGDVCYIVDDQTVAKTDGTASRSPAGIIHDIDDNGVWVRLDEALTKAS